MVIGAQIVDAIAFPFRAFWLRVCGSVYIRLLQQLAADRLSSATVEEDVAWHNDCGTAMLFENREEVLEEVELFLARRRSCSDRPSKRY